jgi:L-lysine 2,3-aminomutase
MNRLTVANPLRLEIETQFLVPEEIKPEHAILAKTLRNRGVTVYSNTPLLATVNDTADHLHRLAFDLRQSGIEFHHIYVAGWSLQEDWSQQHPVNLTDVIDIATKIRRDGSGREIPRYVILTQLGEVDFGLTSRFVMKNDQVFVKLLPYNLAYYRGMHPEFNWPDSVQTDDDSRPVVRLDGVINPCGVHLDDSN